MLSRGAWDIQQTHFTDIDSTSETRKHICNITFQIPNSDLNLFIVLLTSLSIYKGFLALRPLFERSSHCGI